MRDYLLTKLRLKADEQQRAYDIERQRSQTEADIYNAQVKVAGDVANTATKLIGMGAQSVDASQAAQAAKDLEDMDLQAKIQAARDAELAQGSGQVDPVTGQVVAPVAPVVPVVPAGSAATAQLFSNQPADPSMSGGINRRDTTVSATDFQSAPTPVIPSAETLPADATRRPGPVTTAVSPLIPTAATVTEAELAGQKTGVPTAPDVRRSTSVMGVPATAREGAEQMQAFPGSAAAGLIPARPAGLSAADIAAIKSTGVAGANIAGAAPSVSETDLQGAFKPSPPGTPIPGYRGINIQDITGGIPQQVPAAPVIVSTGTAADIPTPAKFKEESGIDLSKPKVREAVEQAPAITGYKPLSFANAKSPQEEAKKIVDQVWKKQPPNNPLTAFFNHGKNTGQMDQARRMAELKAELTIRDTRKQLQAEHESTYLNSLAIKQREEQINLIRAQSVLATSKSDQTIRLKTNMPSSITTLMEGSNLAREKVQSLRQKSDNLLKTTGKLPIGPLRQYWRAVAAAAGYNIGATSEQNVGATLAAKMGIGGSASTGAKYGRSGRQIDVDAYKKAMEAMDNLDLTDEERAWLQEYDQTVQVVGKAREGGKMTDTDQAKYEKMLISTGSGRSFVNSLNDLGETQIGSYNRVRDMTNKTYDIADIYQTDTWEPLEYEGEIGETSLSSKAMLAVPGPVGNPVAASIDTLRSYLNDPNIPTAAKTAIEAEIQRKSAAAKKSTPATGSTTAADPWN